jgi:hypothetical protein
MRHGGARPVFFFALRHCARYVCLPVYTTTVVDDLLALCCDMERMEHTSVGHQHFDAENFLVSPKECVDITSRNRYNKYIYRTHEEPGTS